MNKSSISFRKSVNFAFLFLLTLMAGCGGGGDTAASSGVTLKSIAITPANPSMPASLTNQFTATGTYSDGTSTDITSSVIWSSGDTSVATIDSSGLASGVAAGTSAITATSGSISGSATLTITSATLQSIAVTPASPSIATGLTKQFTATGTYSDTSIYDITSSVTWSSGTTSSATISAGGLASGVAAGTSTITATSGSISGNTTLTVTAATLQSIAVTPASPSIATGLTKQFTATGTYSDASTQDITASVTWISGNTSVATIDSGGLATGVAAGSIFITATLDSITGGTPLTVTAATLQSIAVTPANPSVSETLTKQFTATGTYSDASTQDISSSVTWSSGDTAVATIVSGGLATGVAAGTATITATSGSVSGNTTLTVVALATYSIGGTVSGLSGSGLVLQNNGGGDLTISGNGSFTFATQVTDGQAYSVTVATEPSTPAQGCRVQYGSGTVSSAAVSNVVVTCTTGRYNVVDTNQTACYDSTSGATATCVGTGYDADYSGNQPSYTLSTDGKVVTDNVTGLVWTQSTDIDGSGAVDYADKKYQGDAETYCSSLSLDGYSWRLPSIKELYSLIEFSGTDASSYSGTDTSVLTPFIDHTFDWAFGDLTTSAGIAAGDRIIDAQYATTTTYVSTTMNGDATMFGVNFVDGRIKGYPLAIKKFYVRCVAGSSSYGTNDFADNSDGTITDNATGLMWEKSDQSGLDWDQAVSTCESATTGTHSDWRLPNIKELHTIVDYTRSPDTSSSAAINSLFTTTSITNEGNATDWGYYWGSTTHVGYGGTGDSATYFSFGRALGYFQNPIFSTYSLLDVHGAGTQRSDNKLSAAATPGALTANLGYGTFYYHGPQGDIVRSSNMVRCVR